MTIGETIRKHRLSAGLTQQQLGDLLDIKASGQQRVMHWETNRRTPNAEYLLKLMAVLHIPLTAFNEYQNNNEENEK